MVELTLWGKCPSKKNTYRANSKGIYLTKEVKDQLESLRIQVCIQWAGRDKLISPDMEIVFHVKHLRSDRDNRLSTIMDVLQGSVLKNDNDAQCNGTITLLPSVKASQDKTVIRIHGVD